VEGKQDVDWTVLEEGLMADFCKHGDVRIPSGSVRARNFLASYTTRNY
jgi:hypothetical protein